MNDTKRLGLPLAIILFGAFAIWFVDTYLVMNTVLEFLRTILIVACFFFFGYYLNKKKKSNAVFKKVIAILLTILLTCMRYDMFANIPFIGIILSAFGSEGFSLMLYIYCGYLFAD